MGIFQTPGSNARDINNNIKDFLQKLKLPEGIHYTINYDTNEFLEASITKVMVTLIEAFLLVFLVVYIFLQRFSFHIDTRYRRSSFYYWFIFLFKLIWFLAESSHTLCISFGHRDCSGRCYCSGRSGSRQIGT